MTDNQTPEFIEVTAEEIGEQVRPRPLRAAPEPPEHPSISTIVEGAIDNGRTMVEAQIELTKMKAKASLVKAAGAIVAFVIVILFTLYAGWWAFHTIELAFIYVVPPWAASLITFGIIILLMILTLLVGVGLVKRASEGAPNPGEEIKDDITAVREGLSK